MILICLISRQTMQNLLPILQYRPQRVVFLSTKEEDDSRLQLENILHARRISCDPPLYVDAYDPDSTRQACRQVLARHRAETLVANLTGGTKVMSLAAFRALSEVGVACIYTDTQNQRILRLYPDGQTADRLDTKVDVLTYLQAHGQDAQTRPADSRLSAPSLAMFIGQHIATLDPFLARLRFEMRDHPHQLLFRFSVERKQRHATAGELLHHAAQAGLLTATRVSAQELEVRFVNDKARRYLEGEWLEDLVFETVKKAGFDSCATNVGLRWKDAPEKEMNEVDVAVVHHLRFFYLSCKTSSDPETIKHHLYELETLSGLAGGLFSRPILVASSAKGVPFHLRRRMQALKITHIDPADFPHLTTKLQEVIR